MKFSYITLFPDLIRSYLSDALLARAEVQGILQFAVHSLREFSQNNYRSVDDKPFGGGDGVVIEPEPLRLCLESCLSSDEVRTKKIRVVYLSPQGSLFNSTKKQELLQYEQLIFICGRYGGVDQRFISEFIDEEISIGNYVLSGGELPALVITETLSRAIPGVLGDLQSQAADSLSEEWQGLLEAPQFTRPQEWRGMSVPQVLTSGHHQKIKDWQMILSYLVTMAKRPELVGDRKKFLQSLYEKKIVSVDFLKRVDEVFLSLSKEEKKLLGLQGLERSDYA